MASGYKAVADRADLEVHLLDQGDWGAPKRIRYKAMRYVLIGDDMFYKI
jgi:hypothetical protein